MYSPRIVRQSFALCLALCLTACNENNAGELGNGSSTTDVATLNQQLLSLLDAAAPAQGKAAFQLPAATDFAAIPQDPSNPLTSAKVELGQMLFHETALGRDGNNAGMVDTYSCASCHHAAAGFKAGVPQGIGEGGKGFGINGEGRLLSAGFDATLPDGDPMKPDVQPIASPTVLNGAYQEAMLWNGQFGNAINGVVNADVDPAKLSTPNTPKANNTRMLAGLEIQAIAGLGVHRLKVESGSFLQTNAQYQSLFQAAYPAGSSDVLEDAGKAIAAYERTVLANEAPFQQWLAGDSNAMTDAELRGAIVFFGQGNCVACHRGPALSSEAGAGAEDVFFALGFADLDTSDPRVHGVVDTATSKGRGGLTGVVSDEYKFKVPQLYNLADANILGHGASFTSVREVIEYKNLATPQQALASNNLSPAFVPLDLSTEQMDDLEAFLSNALYDANLERYVPASVPSGLCFPVNDAQSQSDLGCI